MFEIRGKYTTAKVMIDDVEEESISQIRSFVDHPAFTNPVAIMPDCHAGKGSVIGFSMELTDKIVPNVIGVDISCGMLSVNIGKELPMSLELLDHKIRQRIPFGMEVHDRSIIDMKNDFPWHEVRVQAEKFTRACDMNGKLSGERCEIPDYSMPWLEKKCKENGADLGRAIKSIGSLGGGNHFLEIGKDLNDDFWVTVHSGSRNIGLKICNYWQNIGSRIVRKQKKALLKERIAYIRDTYKGMEIKDRIREAREELGLNEEVSDSLQYIEESYAMGYLYDMIFAQRYASLNRTCMMDIVLDIVGLKALDTIETVHNFIDFRDFIIRKGAIRSYIGERMIIPFNMRDGILICEGKSNPEWNYTAPHGAGRVLSRGAARKKLDVDEFKKQMEGVYSTSVCFGTIDEAPDAYKDSEIIEEAIEPTAKILNRIKPVLNMKDKGK